MPARPAPLALTFALTLLGVVLGGAHARAQDGDAPDAADVEDRERIETLVRSLNNPVVLRVPGELRDRIDRLLSSGHPLARRKLREILGDTGARPIVVEQIVTSVLVDRGALDLVPEVVERLRVERDSPLGRSFDDVLMRYADTDLVRRLSDLALDDARSADYRATAAAILGRTGHAAALPSLLELWGSDDGEVRTAASRGFIAIVPFVTSREEGQRVVKEMREEQLSLAEVLRRRLRELQSVPRVEDASDYRSEYLELARTALPHVPLEEVLRLYVRSPVPDLRAAAALRLREIDWDAQPEPTQARRAAGKALLDALRTEEVAVVEAEILDTLLPLAPALRENVDDADLGALTSRAQGSAGAGRPVRRASIRLLGALRDRRPVPLLQAEFDALRDTDPELRIEILGALASSGEDLTRWLAERVLREPDVRVAREMVLKLGQATDPAAVGVFVQLLRDGHEDERLRSYVVQALASLWANSGVERARDALIEYGLNDPLPAIREVSANGLGNPRPGERAPVLSALGAVVGRADEDVRVRVAAARAVLDLDTDGALARLQPYLTVGAIWDVYRNRRTEDLRGSHVTVEDVLRDADALWEAGDPDLRERAVLLLQAVVDSGADLWEGRNGRGVVRERLARRLLASGRPSDACAVAESLLAASPREGDPRHRWRLILGRSLRACGAAEDLVRAQRELTALRTDEALPSDLRPSVLLELGHVLLLRDDPTAARAAFASIGDGRTLLSSADTTRLKELETEAAERSEAERLQVLGLVDRITEPDAQEELRAIGGRAARQVDTALVAADAAGDTDRVRRLLLAAAALSRRTFDLPVDATPEQIAGVVADARAALAALIAGETPSER